MTEPIDLSQLNEPTVHEASAHLHQVPDPEPEPEVAEFVTAFLVVQNTDGQWLATTNLDIPFSVQRPGTQYDMQAGSLVVSQDLAAIRTMQMTTKSVIENLSALQQQAVAQMQQAQQAEETRKIARLLDAKGGLRS